MNELAVYQDKMINNFDDVERAAKAMAGSGFFTDTKQAAQAIVKIMAGAELGVGAFASMVGVNIIQGKPTFSANIMAAAVKRSGRYNYRVAEMTDKNCAIEFMERFDGKWQTSGVSTFGIDDARKAGTKNLDKFPRNMLFARAMSNGVRWYCPDVMNGSVAYTPEELGADVDQDGNVITVEPVEVVEPEQASAPEPIVYETAEPSMTIEDAYRVTNSEGVQYGTLSQEKLSNMTIGIGKALKKNELTPVEKAEYERKLEAIKILLAAKADGSIS